MGIGVHNTRLRDTQMPPGVGKRVQSGCNVHAITVTIAALDHEVTKFDSDAKL